jgi:hypothetical protein
MVQVHVPATVWGFESLRWHQKYYKSIVEPVRPLGGSNMYCWRPLTGLAEAVPFHDDP